MIKAVEIESRGLKLRGMLHVPENPGRKVPVACIFHGFPGNRMEAHFIFVKLSRLLAEKGIASVRFDLAGSGESDGEFSDMTISTEIEDAKAILDYARTLEFADADKIALVGLSMGGVVASITAADRREEVKALCLWAPAGNMKALEIDSRSLKELQKFKEQGFADIGGLALGYGFVEDLLALNMYERAAGYDRKVLLIHGDRDECVPLKASEDYMEVYGDRAKLHVVRDGDHTFNTLKHEREVLECTAGFLEKELL